MFVRIVRNCGMLLDVVRDDNAKCEEQYEKRILCGKNYYLQIMSDGTAHAGCYSRDGKYQDVTPEIINDVFNLQENRKLWNGRVLIAGVKGFILNSRVTDVESILGDIFTNLEENATSELIRI